MEVQRLQDYQTGRAQAAVLQRTGVRASIAAFVTVQHQQPQRHASATFGSYSAVGGSPFREGLPQGKSEVGKEGKQGKERVGKDPAGGTRDPPPSLRRWNKQAPSARSAASQGNEGAEEAPFREGSAPPSYDKVAVLSETLDNLAKALGEEHPSTKAVRTELDKAKELAGEEYNPPTHCLTPDCLHMCVVP